jgi:hypothetical protein
MNELFHRYQYTVKSSTYQRTADHENEFFEAPPSRLEVNRQRDQHCDRPQPGHLHCTAKHR